MVSFGHEHSICREKRRFSIVSKPLLELVGYEIQVFLIWFEYVYLLLEYNAYGGVFHL